MVTDELPADQTRSFAERVRRAVARNRSWLCLGIDPDLSLIPGGGGSSAEVVLEFSRRIIDATTDHVAAFKINFAFFEALGPTGWETLYKVRSMIPGEVPVIADAKRGDIPNTARAYAQAILQTLDFDAITVNPYLGLETIEPFAEFKGKGVFVLAKTSNSGATDFQDVEGADGEPLYFSIARRVLEGAHKADVGFVVGATYPEALGKVRSLHPNTLILTPGVGAQGGNLADTMIQGSNAHGENLLVAVSRSVTYVTSDPERFPSEVRVAAQRLAAQTWNTPAPR